ncbi:MAG: SnoaL-like protein [Bacteroidota bacterium]|nr:SnoaL-like protein [Bacteroidota bacterium]
MTKFLLPLFMVVILASCCPEPKLLSPEEVEKEKNAIIAVNKAYNVSSEEKNFSAMVETLAGEVIFFGTDSAEIIRTFADFKTKMLDQWKQYDKIKYGEMVDISIQMDKNATFASMIYGIPCTLTKGGTSSSYFLRVARMLKKENDKWVIVSGIVGLTSNVALVDTNTLKTGTE